MFYSNLLRHVATLVALLFFSIQKMEACSMCKITSDGKTIVGNNEDAWRKGSRIWFEKGNDSTYGAGYVGHDDGFPQGGMNEAGLVFDGLTVYPRVLHPVEGKKRVTNASGFLKDILQHCASVDEVAAFASQYDRSIFNRGMFLFVDKTGRYLVMEVDTLIMGRDSTYILANFCPSQTKPEEVTFTRYLKGNSFLAAHLPEASSRYATAIMDTMHECRAKIGDGTTYTSIYDLNEGLITLYFYHDFSKKFIFRLKDELLLPDHVVEMTTLFPVNREYQAFTAYRTPFNSQFIQGLAELSRIFYLLMTVIFIFLFIRNFFRPATSRRAGTYNYLILAITNMILFYFVKLLLTNQPLYYFDAPYSFGNNAVVNLMIYVPWALLIGLVPLIFSIFKSYKSMRPGYFIAILIALNLFAYITVLTGAGYWGLFNIG